MACQAGSADKCPEPDGPPYAWFNGVNWASDTVPLNHVRLVSVNGSRVLLLSRGGAGRRCVLQRSPEPAAWQAVASAVTASDGTAQLRGAASLSSGGFYRVVVE